MALTTFLLVRHGQTAWNKDLHFRGTVDLDLTETGRDQAQRIADRLRHEPVRAIYSSPLSRTVETARPLADALGLQILLRHELISVDYGQWQGHSPKEVSELWPDLYRTWLRSPDQVVFPGGESLTIVRDRADALLADLSETHAGETLVLVSHEVVTKVIMLMMLGMDLSQYWRIPQDNACINAFTREGAKWSLKYLNDTCHLQMPHEN